MAESDGKKKRRKNIALVNQSKVLLPFQDASPSLCCLPPPALRPGRLRAIYDSKKSF